MELLLLVIIGFIFGTLSAFVAPEGKQGPAFFLGLLFGPLGLLMSVIIARN